MPPFFFHDEVYCKDTVLTRFLCYLRQPYPNAITSIIYPNMQFIKKSIQFFLLATLLLPCSVLAQQAAFDVQNISLPAELLDAENQYSSLNIYKKQILLMAESRVLEKQEAKLYCVSLRQIDKKLKDSSHVLAYKKIPIKGLEFAVNKMLEQKQVCEGLEAMVIHGSDVYFSVETTTPSDYVYLLKGKMKKKAVVLDSTFMLPIWKPRNSRAEIIYNASFECMEWYHDRLFIFFEFNYFDRQDYVYSYNGALEPASKDSFPIDKMPYRISDLKANGVDHFIAVNSFYKGGGKDTINRPHTYDTAAYRLVHDEKGFHDYTRLVDIHFNGSHFTWQPVFEMPKMYEGFNWEGIACYKNGYFLITDKYAPSKPYYSKFVYLKPNSK